ncbi:D-ribose pyranase [Litorivicinus lipolyticus]|uniref:D-ribose pyranase n=1 Tax=Litorivicinus lipolyticus TaxID=418701 RepID=A0A5Q2QF84_9GAMM|nr:D-ribose pyranase [Litorivicinus lipolyticus]QGG80667.1 D-ribose pyranase [Litorivicinus lipolyticus]
MKKTLLLNSALSRIVAEAGHGDLICVADTGLPIPAGPERIDLSVSPSLPSTLQLLNALSSELCVESITYAHELDLDSGQQTRLLSAISQGWSHALAADADTLPHEQFKQLTRQCKAIIRTGDFTPYYNVILRCGVPF